jgi:hypothetical protein
MKPRILLLSILAATCAIGLGVRPPRKDHCLVSLKPVFQCDDEQVWHLTIETREPAQYRIVSADIGGVGGLGGDTAPAKGRRGRCEDGVWLVFSQVRPPGDGPAYLKTILKSQSGSLSQTREIARAVRLSDVVAAKLIGEPSEHLQNIPLVLADMDGQRVRLMVGMKSDKLDSERGGAPSAAPPLR